jgi:hypothetical protein
VRLCSLLFAIVAVLSWPGRSFAATEIPCELRDGMVWVKVTPAGSSEPLHFLLDSGASVSVLDLGTARRLNTKLGAAQSAQGVHTRATAYRVPSFGAHLGGVALPKSLLALDLSPVSARCHRRINGLLGADFFRGRIVQIDYAARKVRLLSRNELNTAGHTALPLAMRNDALCVRVSVASQPAEWTRVDTGCNSALQWATTRPTAEKLGISSIALTARCAPCISADVQLGPARIAGVKVGVHTTPIFPGEAGLLGNALLSRFATVTFDPARRTLFLASR